MDVSSFISRYEVLLKERHISKADFYKACKISAPAVSNWRARNSLPAMTTISRIADFLETTPEYLLTGKKNIAAISGDDYGAKARELIPQLAPEHQKLVLDLIQSLVPPKEQA